jgi:hypothetical protein
MKSSARRELVRALPLAHLTLEGLEQIKQIQAGMNRGRMNP